MKLVVTLDGSTLAEEVLPPVAKLAAKGYLKAVVHMNFREPVETERLSGLRLGV